MAKNTIPRGETSVIRHIVIYDSASTTGAGKTGISYNATGISSYYIYAGSTNTALTLETIATLGSYVSPTSNSHLRFKQINATNMPGWYELQMHNDWFSISNNRKTAGIQIKGVSGMVPMNLEIDIIGVNIQATIVDANVLKVNDITVQGSGTSGEPWGPA